MTESDAGQIDHLPTREGYDRWAEIYDAEDNPLIALEEPLVAALLGDVRGLSVADIGCGTGRHALRLAAAGAALTALDFSDRMLDKAQGKPGADGIRFIAHDLAAWLPLPHAAFDRVLCCLVADHVEDLCSLFGELARVCRPDGAVVFSVMHPAMMLRGLQARFTDPLTGRETRPRSYPHLIADYVTAATRAGLHIAHISEHAADESLAQRCPRAAKYVAWPLLFLMQLTRQRFGVRQSSGALDSVAGSANSKRPQTTRGLADPPARTMNTQGQLGLDSAGPEDGYSHWLSGRRMAAAELARRIGLPLGHEVEVWLHGGIRLRGKLRLQEEMLFIEEERLRHLELVVDRVTFTYREMESCVRLD